ncbi:Imm26 family immunity protein [Paenibacillus sp. BJ-4]|uniref:Imm26 family immunity protein n=1 Tax=Paenibacillus sp. BJ-4 TaxID=2878097 RepID=UPI001CEFCD02|nr:Imm26 family immunity protein [Paenibacillus sp. BJ-4]
MIFKRVKHREGGIFVIPTHDGRFAVCQVICAPLKSSFSGVKNVRFYDLFEKEERTWNRNASRMIMAINMILAL